MNVIIKQTKNHSGFNKQADQDYSDIKTYEMKVNARDSLYCYEVFISKFYPFLFQKTKRLCSMEENIVFKKSYR